MPRYATALAGDPARTYRQVDLDGRTGAATVACEHPIIYWLSAGEVGNRYGAVLCIWSMHNSTHGQIGNEVRASLCVLSNTAEDAAVSAWSAPGASSSTTIR